jgi:hypothetical protein
VLTPGRTGPLTSPIVRSGRKSLIVVGGVAVLALIAGGIAFVALDSHPGQAAASATTSVSIPAVFAGTWTGAAKQSSVAVPGIAVPDTVTFTFIAGGTTAHEVNTAPVGPACIDTLTLSAETATRLTFREPGNAQCAAGTTTFTRRGVHLAYRWTDSVEQNAGTLRKR